MNRTFISCIAAAAMLAGCGGSGDGNGGQTTGPVVYMPIDSNNAVQATGTSYKAARPSGEFSDYSGDAGFAANAPGQTAKTGLDFASKAGDPSQVPLPEQRVPCDVSGEVIFNMDLADPITPTLSRGDTIDIEFDMCIDTVGESTDGRMHFEVDDFAGDFLSALYDLTMTMTLTDFNVVTQEDSIMSSGGATVRIDTVLAPYVEASVSGDSFTVDTNSASQSLTNFASTQTFDGNLVPAPYTFSASGTVDSSDLPGAVTYSTPVTFEGFDDDYPSAGEFLVEGENSAAKLVALSNVDVQILIDADGDGVFEGEILTTWAELDAQ